MPLEESLGALAELRVEGKIRHAAVSNVDAVRSSSGRRRSCPSPAVQNRLSLAERGSEPVLAACERDGTAFVAWAPLAKGFFAGAKGPPAAIAGRHGATPAQVSLAWLLACSPVTIAIPGTANVAHLEENVGAATLELTPEEVDVLAGHRDRRYEARRLERKARVSWGRLKRRVRRR